MNSSHGFSLIELLITLAIICILSAIALPIYSQHIVTEQRLEAAQMLTQLALAMEEYYLQNNTYQTATLNTLHFPEQIVRGSYQLGIQAATNEKYAIIASPINRQAENDLACGTLKLNNLGEKTISGSGSVDQCW